MASDRDNQTINALIAFWFADDTKPRWYNSTAKFDQHCRERFADLCEQAAAGQLRRWQNTAEGALALCLLLDQIPRNIFRGTPKAFETDPKAVEVAGDAIDRGLDQELDLEKRKFLYLPFMHSEVLADQERSLELSRAVNDDNTMAYAVDHADIVRRFGRFPHRNKILGRECTTEEETFLADGAKDYGQSTK